MLSLTRLRSFLFKPGKVHAKPDLVLHKYDGKKQRKRNELEFVNDGALLARCTARESEDCGYGQHNANLDKIGPK